MMSVVWAPLAVAALQAAMKALQIPGDDLMGAGLEVGLNLAAERANKRPAQLTDVIKLISRRQMRQFDQFDQFEVNVAENERRAAIGIVESLVTEHPLSYAEMEEAEFSPDRLTMARSAEFERRAREALLSEAASGYAGALYRLTLRQITAIVQSSPAFVSRLSLETYLTSKSAPRRLADSLDQIFIPSTRHGTAAEHAVFLASYLDEIAKRHGRTQLFGLDDVPSALRWSSLDDTYVSLSASRPVGPGMLARASHAHSALMGEPGVQGSRPFEETLADLMIEAAAASRGIRLVISGTAGSGKTTLVKWLATRLAVSHHTSAALPEVIRTLAGKVPIVVPLRTTILENTTAPSTEDLLGSFSTTVMRPGDWLERTLQSGNAVILFDGLDELLASRRSIASEWIEQIGRMYPKVDVVVTMRPEAVDRSLLALNDFSLADLQPMNLAQSISIVDRWFDAQCFSAPLITAEAYRDRQEDLRSLLIQDSFTQEIAETPLLAAMLCAYYAGSSGEGPRDQKKLISGVISVLIDGRDRARGLIPNELKTVFLDHKLSIIGQIASAMFQRGSSTARIPNARDGIRTLSVEVAGDLVSIDVGSCPAPVPDVLAHILDRSGLLVRVTSDEVQFAHRIFLEFLAAHRLLQEGDRSALLSARGHPGWFLVIANYSWLAPDHESVRLISDLLALSDLLDEASSRRLSYALADCVSGVVNYPPSVAEDVATKLRRNLPPTSLEEISLLASLGSVALSLVRNPKTIDEAIAAVSTASRIRTPEALEFVAELATGGFGPRLVPTLVEAWRKFPAEQYASDVLAALDLQDTVVFVPSARAAEALHFLNKASRFQFGRCDGLTSVEFADRMQSCVGLDLLEAVDIGNLDGLFGRSDLARLRLPRSGRVRDIGVLGALVQLEELHISACDHVDRLESIGNLVNLRSLHLGNVRAGSMPDLRGITKLRSLSVDGSELNSLDFLPAAPLERLSLSTVESVGSIDLEGYAGLRRLEVAVVGTRTLRLPRRNEEIADGFAVNGTINGIASRLKMLKVTCGDARYTLLLGNLEAQASLTEIVLSGDITPIGSDDSHMSPGAWSLVRLASARSLRRVTVRRNPRLTSLNGISSLAQLRFLDVSETAIDSLGAVEVRYGYDDEGMRVAQASKKVWSIADCGQLRELHLDECHRLSDTSILHRCGSLEYVSMRGKFWPQVLEGLVNLRARVDYDESLFFQETG